ncbi:putative bifunctional diguanylate cyclase/phosphodiesterase [Actinomycetospora aeridis]|uniref:Bifunctional diguanylate cyclase/phosphodiesterase n=1 Tax=Actinomycetospora aeridis TaxID=3129231 RepID=A0ABU8N8K8_9PSEU
MSHAPVASSVAAVVTPALAAPAPAAPDEVSPVAVLVLGGLLVLVIVGSVVGLLVQWARRRRHDAEAEALAARLRRDAHRDPLTGLLNREGFLHAAVAPGGAVAVVDLALLGQVNDTLGHARGEVFVRLATERLVSVRLPLLAGAEPVAARLEGDTFAVLLPGVDGHEAHAAAEDLRERLLAPYLVEGVRFEPPVVVGVAADGPWLADVQAGPERTAALLRRADVALAATRDGGDPVRCYEPSMGERAARRLRLIRGFSAAVSRRDVRVDFQPVVSLGERTVVGVEALARWDHPELGLLLPDEFVPVLEATGQIAELTSFVLDESLAAARRWLDRGMRLSVAVNVSVGNLGSAGFPDEVASLLAVHGVPAELLTLELTESGVSSEREVALPVLRRLHALGCHLAVDDFGTGQSSLAHLRRLPVDQVKIDKSFVLGMGTEYGDVAVVRAIVEMGHTLGLTVVAEGVERAAVRAALVDMGCDVAQGYLVSRPLPARCFDSWLDSLDVHPGEPGAAPGPRTLIA